jgi:hypothetical protein
MTNDTTEAISNQTTWDLIDMLHHTRWDSDTFSKMLWELASRRPDSCDVADEYFCNRMQVAKTIHRWLTGD